jgi:tRNA(adenine34) deaminase
MSNDDEQFMAIALEEARRCMRWGDVPIGAVVVRGDEVLGAAGNARERRGDPTAHAEIQALRQAAPRVGSWRLKGCTIYVTLEPCAMCAGAMVLARLDRLVFGAADPKAGFVGSLGNLVQDPRLNTGWTSRAASEPAKRARSSRSSSPKGAKRARGEA